MSANATPTPGSPVSVASFAWSDFTNWVPKASENNTTVHPASATPTPGSPASGASLASSDFTDVVPRASEHTSSDSTDVVPRASEHTSRLPYAWNHITSSQAAIIAMYEEALNAPEPEEPEPAQVITITLPNPPAAAGGEAPSSSGETDATSVASSDDGRAPTVSERMTWISEWSDAGAPIRNRRRRPPPRGPLVRRPVLPAGREEAVPDTQRLLSHISTLQEQFEAERDVNAGHLNSLQNTVSTLAGSMDALHGTVATLQGTLDALVATHQICYPFNGDRTCSRNCKRLHICVRCRGRHPLTKCEQPDSDAED